MLSWLGLTLLGFTAVSSFTVHQHSDSSECVNLQCPETAFDYGVKNLVNDETMKSDQCTSCSQCTENGYSLCLRQKDSRAHRTATETTGFCSCAHSVPANCHNQLHISTHPANITMKLYSLCYQSAIQAPPKPLAVNDKDSVIVTVEAFWHEPYWREMQLDNLTLTSEFVVKTPEDCEEGEVITLESDHHEHLCKRSVNIQMTSQPEGHAKDDDYEHSENYDQYDDDLPPEVQFDRDVFAGAKLLQAYYTVAVRRPRQLDTKSSDPFRDVTTTLESEHLKFDLKPEIYGEGTSELPESKKEVETADDDEDVSSESPSVGTDFFEDGKNEKDTKSEEETEKEEEKLEKEIEEDDKKTTEEGDDEEATTVADDEDKNEEEKDADEEATTEESEKDGDDDEDKENDEEKDEAADEDEDEKKDDDENNEDEDEDGEKKEGDDEEEETTAEGEETTEESETGENKEEADENAEDDEEESDEEKGFFSAFIKDQYHLARWVFGITIASCVILIVCTCCYRRGLCCCKPNETKTTSNGCRYTNANRPELAPLTADPDVLPVSESEQRMFKDILIRSESLNPAKLEMGSTIGNGRFGVWNRALFNSFNGSVLDVAVYTIRNPMELTPTDFRALASALKETVVVGIHPNVLSLKAAHLDRNALTLLWEPISHPTLQGVLRESRCSRFGSSPYKAASFLSPERLLSIMIGCVTGVDHLLKRNIFHNHLATANVLVAERGQVKISGFGLAETAVLCREHEARPNPLRWMSPEHFRSDRKPAKESQIWSLGVLLWEIISLGATPYANVRTSREIIDSLRDETAKLAEVQYCGTAIMDLIYSCTSHEPSARPDPDTILRRLECIAADAQHHIDLRMKENFPYLAVCTQIEQQKVI
ncbi:unnamed protein product [Auanema sp. JU1783]|nr:unnamed protein product [Auanema sp. JU1783]